MRQFFSRLQNALIRFMYGRNGSDQLNMARLVVYLILWLLRLIFAGTKAALGVTVCDALMLALAVVVLWRTFSKNLDKRRGENARFLNWWSPVKSRFTGAAQRRQDKAHKYFTCKNCKAICRVPAGKGKIEITCPKCGTKITGRS